MLKLMADQLRILIHFSPGSGAHAYVLVVDVTFRRVFDNKHNV